MGPLLLTLFPPPPAMEKFTFCLRGGLAKRLERLSTSHGPGYLDYLLETHTPDTDLPSAPAPAPRPVTDWAPKIGVDDLTKSIEIDVGSQVGGRAGWDSEAGEGV